MAKMIRGIVAKIFLGLLLVALITPLQAWAAPNQSTLKLINNRSETVWVAISNWDFDRNTSFTKGWYAVKPNSRIAV